MCIRDRSISSSNETSKDIEFGSQKMSSGDFGFLVNLVTFMPLFSNRQVSEEPTRPVAPLINMFLGCNLSE